MSQEWMGKKELTKYYQEWIVEWRLRVYFLLEKKFFKILSHITVFVYLCTVIV